MTRDVLFHEVPQPFGLQNASHLYCFRCHTTYSLVLILNSPIQDLNSWYPLLLDRLELNTSHHKSFILVFWSSLSTLRKRLCYTDWLSHRWSNSDKWHPTPFVECALVQCMKCLLRGGRLSNPPFTILRWFMRHAASSGKKFWHFMIQKSFIYMIPCYVMCPWEDSNLQPSESKSDASTRLGYKGINIPWYSLITLAIRTRIISEPSS